MKITMSKLKQLIKEELAETHRSREGAVSDGGSYYEEAPKPSLGDIIQYLRGALVGAYETCKSTIISTIIFLLFVDPGSVANSEEEADWDIATAWWLT